MAKFTLTVHGFEPQHNTLIAEPSADERLLTRGRDLVARTLNSKDWRFVTPDASSMVNAVTRHSPVRTSTHGAVHSLPLSNKEKPGTDAALEQRTLLDGGQGIDINALEEFQSTDLSYLLALRPLKQGEKRRNTELDITEKLYTEIERSPKRRKFDTQSLYGLLPQPHHHSYPLFVPIKSPELDVRKHFKPYSKSPLVSFNRYPTRRAEDQLAVPFARCAWIVPVSGQLPWRDASMANILEDVSFVTIQNTSKRSGDIIYWTPQLLQQFWSFLLEVRKHQTLGVISLSYHVASGDYIGRTRQSENSVLTLLKCTHIKIYHDAPFALYVRSILDAWKIEAEAGGTAALAASTPSASKTHGSGEKPSTRTKLRPLLGTKLVLVNEASVAIGLC